MEKKHPIGKRFAAWFIDNTLITILSVVALTESISVQFQPQKMLEVFQGIPGFQSQLSRWEELSGSFEDINLNPQEEAVIKKIMEESFGNGARGQIPTDFFSTLETAGDPGAALSKLMNRGMEVLSNDPRLSEINPAELAKINRAVGSLSTLLSEVQSSEWVSILVSLVSRVSFWVFLVPLLYFSLEMFLGFSLGKLILGLRISHKVGDSSETGNVLVYIFRYSLKCSGWIVAAIGVWQMNVLVILLGFALSGIMGLSGFGLLNTSFQTLYDGISRTTVESKKVLDS